MFIHEIGSTRGYCCVNFSLFGLDYPLAKVATL